MKLEMKFFCSTFFLVFLLCPAAAEDQPAGWRGDFSIGLAMTRGNSQTTNLSISFAAKREVSAKLEWLNSGFYLLSRDDGNKSAESIGLSTRVNRLLDKRLHIFCEFQGLRDEFKDWLYRLTPAAGMGYKAVLKKRVELGIHGGISYVMTKYRSSGEKKGFAGFKLGSQFSWKISKTADLTGFFDAVFDLAQLDAYFIRSGLGLAAAITKNWALSLSLVDSYDAKPLTADIKKNDLALTAGLTKKF